MPRYFVFKKDRQTVSQNEFMIGQSKTYGGRIHEIQGALLLVAFRPDQIGNVLRLV